MAVVGRLRTKKRMVPVKKSIDRFFHGDHLYEQNHVCFSSKDDRFKAEKLHEMKKVCSFGDSRRRHSYRKDAFSQVESSLFRSISSFFRTLFF